MIHKKKIYIIHFGEIYSNNPRFFRDQIQRQKHIDLTVNDIGLRFFFKFIFS